MSAIPLASVLRRLGRLAAVTGGQATDGELLQRFLGRRDEAAFAALVQRHGPMVLGVVRRVLRHEQDAEDAFQAAFLVLARRAAVIRRHNSVGSWLHGVALRVARKARVAAARRRSHERHARAMTQSPPEADLAWQELQALLDEEVQRLPEKYRTPFVLCCLEGKTKDEAARQLGWPAGTVSGRLARAREWLRERLRRRSVVLSAAALGTLLAGKAVPGAVPPALAAAAVRAALAGPTAGAVSARAADLAGAVLRATALGKLRLATGVALALTLLAAGLALCARQALPGPAGPGGGAGTPAAPADDPRPAADRQGDPLPEGVRARLGTVRFRGAGWGSVVAYLPDGKRLVTGSRSGGAALDLWDTATGQRVGELDNGNKGTVWALALAPGGKLLAAGGTDHLIHLWDLDAGKEVRHFTGHQDFVQSVAFAPDGKWLASGARDRTVRLWDVATGTELRKLGPLDAEVGCVAVSPDGKLLVTGGNKERPRVWDPATGQELPALEGQPGESRSLAFSPDGRRLAVGTRQLTVAWWDVGSRKLLHEHSLAPGSYTDYMGVAFSPDGKVLAGACFDGQVRLWDPATGKEIARRDSGQGMLGVVTFSHDGKTLALGGVVSVCLRDAATLEDRLPWQGHRGAVNAVGFSPDGKTLASGGGDRTVILWDWPAGKERRRLVGHEGDVSCLAFAPDGNRLASGEDVVGHGVWLWDTRTGKELRRFATSPFGVRGVAWSPDGKTLAGACEDGTVRLWEVETGIELGRFEGHQPFVNAVAFAPDGKLLASAGMDRAILFWDVSRRREVRRLLGHQDRVDRVVFSPDGRLLASCSWDRSVRLWEVATGRRLCVLPAEQSQLAFVTFSPDGRLLATAEYAADPKARLWEVATGREVGRVEHHGTALAFAPDGKVLAGGQYDSTVLLWDVPGLLRRPRGPVAELSPGDLDQCWADLAGRDGEKAYQALGRLVTAPGQSVPFLSERLQKARPAGPELRERLARLIADLDSDRFERREKATEELAKLGSDAEPALWRALEGRPSPETRHRLQRLLDDVGGPDASPDRLRTGRALLVLEQIGSREACRLVEDLAAEGEEGAWLTREARAARDRLRKRAEGEP
jgi:RNA polymerase sigma factor (sigma-70 family)